jgi:hypothetical protein
VIRKLLTWGLLAIAVMALIKDPSGSLATLRGIAEGAGRIGTAIVEQVNGRGK